jgi:hypothetical protein
VEAREDGVESLRLEGRLSRQVRAGYAGREPEVVLDPHARAGLASQRPGLGDERPQALGGAVDRGREARRSGAEHDEVEDLPVDLGAQAERARHLRGRRVAQDAVVAYQHRRLVARDAECVEQAGALGVGVDVVPLHGQEVALEQITDLEGPV